jgi:hypothetical protein
MSYSINEILISKLETMIAEETQSENQKLIELEETLARVSAMLPILFSSGEPYCRAEMTLATKEEISEQVMGKIRFTLKLLEDGNLYEVKTVSRDHVSCARDDWRALTVQHACALYGYDAIVTSIEEKLDEILASYDTRAKTDSLSGLFGSKADAEDRQEIPV